jgi:Secretion system C-terminal sorting domain
LIQIRIDLTAFDLVIVTIFKFTMKKTMLLSFFLVLMTGLLQSRPSVARLWNETTLTAIRGDLARPTVHARNLFHISVVMYDAWAVYSETGDTYFLGKTLHGFTCEFSGTPRPIDIQAAQEEALSFAVYRLLRHRFDKSPGKENSFLKMDLLMDSLHYNRNNTSTNYKCGPAELGNYLAQQIIEYGLQDGSNESDGYKSISYKPLNAPLVVEVPGNPDVTDLNRWQPLKLKQIIDQSGNPIPGNIQSALSPEWGKVLPFSLLPEDAVMNQRDGFDYWVYHDPGPPPSLDTSHTGGLSEEFKWGHELVSVWSSHLDPNDGVLWDISPASVGNIQDYPTDIVSLRDFYDLLDGGDPGIGHSLNPKTGNPYPAQVVPRGDYTRVLAEFWADGPTSETPPGHWFSILNYVNDHPSLVKKIRGAGPLCDDLEWDVKSYFSLGGALHDVAVTAWGIKGWYDGSRPISALRGMAELGQSSDSTLSNYHPGGLTLIPGYVEIIQPGDSLQGLSGQYIGEVKFLAWKGPNFVDDPEIDYAGVGWVRAKNWWPYQRPTFVTPPFAGYISGHSTYSRAGAEVLTALTGDAYFPGGLAEFHCKQNEYLVFEEGPSVDVTLQWATYRDASDQCSLSRIWGGIHPPFDDIPGRLIGMKIGVAAFAFAEKLFNTVKEQPIAEGFNVFPNPTNCAVEINASYNGSMPLEVYSSDGKLVRSVSLEFSGNTAFLNLGGLPNGTYLLIGFAGEKDKVFEEKVLLLID